MKGSGFNRWCQEGRKIMYDSGIFKRVFSGLLCVIVMLDTRAAFKDRDREIKSRR